MKIILNNFRKHRDLTLDIEEGSTIIRGKNAAGKSTIFDAIIWVLYKAIQKPCSWDKSNCSVTLVDDSSSPLITVNRTKNPRKVTISITSRNKDIIYEDDQAEAEIARYYGSKTLFLSSTLIRQKMLHPLFDLPVKDKLDLLGEIALKDDDHVTLINSILPVEIKRLKDRSCELNIDKVSTEARRSQFRKYHRDFINLQYDDSFNLEEAKSALEDKKKIYISLKKELKSSIAANDKIDHVQKKLKKTHEELRILVDRRSKVLDLTDVEPEYNSVIDSMNLLTSQHDIAKSQLGKAMDKIPEYLHDVPLDIIEAEVKVKESSMYIDHRYSDMLHKANVSTTEELEGILDDIKLSISRLSSEYKSMSEAYNLYTSYVIDKESQDLYTKKYEAAKDIYDKDLVKYQTALEIYEDHSRRFIEFKKKINISPALGIKGTPGIKTILCPCCSLALNCHGCNVPIGLKQGKAVIAHIKQNEEAEDTDVSITVEPIRPVCPRLGMDPPVTKELIEPPKVDRNDMINVQDELQKLKYKCLYLTSIYKEASQLIGTECNGNIELQYLKDYKGTIEDIKNYIECNKVYSNIDILPVKEEYDRLHDLYSEFTLNRSIKMKIDARQSVISAKVDKYRSEISSFGTIRNIDDIKSDISLCHDEVSDLSLHIDGYLIHKEYKDTVSALRHIKLDMKDIEDDLVSLDMMMSRSKEAECIVLVNIVDAINSELSNIISTMFDEPITVCIKLNKKIKSCRSNEDNNRPGFRFKVVYKGRKSDSLVDLSPGQERKVNTALYLAISRICNSRFLLLDEALIYIDSDIRLEVVNIINRYKSDRVIIIEHDLPISDFDHVIDL